MITELFVSLINLAYLHSLDPIALHLGSLFAIRWYGLSYLAGFFFAYLFLYRLSKQGRISLSPELVSDFVFTVAVGTVIGGRVGFCLFYDLSLFSRFSSSFPFWGVLEVHKGGMASHGGIIGIVVSCIYFARKHKLLTISMLDLVALVGCMGIFFGRLANFVNGELVGRPVNAESIFAVQFPQDLYSWPIEQRYALKPLAQALHMPDSDFDHNLLAGSGYYFDTLAHHAVEKVHSGDFSVEQALRQILISRHPSQLYAALLEGLILFVIILGIWNRFPLPGIASVSFMLGYPVMRIISESFRLPDTNIGFQLFGLTRGQWLSIGMLITGICYALWIRNKVNAK